MSAVCKASGGGVAFEPIEVFGVSTGVSFGGSLGGSFGGFSGRICDVIGHWAGRRGPRYGVAWVVVGKLSGGPWAIALGTGAGTDVECLTCGLMIYEYHQVIWVVMRRQ